MTEIKLVGFIVFSFGSTKVVVTPRNCTIGILRF
jgi:hypothetical protein